MATILNRVNVGAILLGRNPNRTHIEGVIMRTAIIVFTSLMVTTLMTISVSEAQASNWSMAAASCVPGDPAIQGNLHFITAGTVSHKEGAIERITLYCPITGTWGGKMPTWLSFTYGLKVNSAPPSPDQTATITAQVIRLTQSDGTLSNIGNPVSVRAGQTTPSRGKANSQSFNHPFDFKNSFYYVRVDIVRGHPGTVATLYGVGLHCTTCLAN